jgi:hypothetical protein
MFERFILELAHSRMIHGVHFPRSGETRQDVVGCHVYECISGRHGQSLRGT